MARAEVRIDGQWLRAYGRVSQLIDTWLWRAKTFDGDPAGWSGCGAASLQWDASPDFASLARKGLRLEINEYGRNSWSGTVTAVTPGDGGLRIEAQGYGALFEQWRAYETNASPPGGGLPIKDSVIANNAIDHAVANRAFPISRAGVSISSTAVGTGEEQSRSMADLFDQTAKRDGKRWVADQLQIVSMASDPTTPIYMIRPGRDGYPGVADDQYVTHLYGRFAQHLDASGNVDVYGYVMAGSDEMAAQNQRREVEVDLTPLGVITSTTAQTNVNGRFLLVGARMGWTEPIELDGTNLYRMGFGPASPLSLRAGVMLRIPNISDNKSTVTTRASIDLIAGKVTRYHDTGRAVVEPLGFAARDFQGQLAAAQAPPTSDAA